MTALEVSIESLELAVWGDGSPDDEGKMRLPTVTSTLYKPPGLVTLLPWGR